jgi:hypothetical protein
MAAREIDLDKVVDYRAEYTAVVQKYKLAGDKLTGLCPFHEDRNNSFSVDLRTGKWHCFAEDRGGNFVSFWAELHGVDTKEAYKQILEKYGVSPEAPKPAKKEKTTALEDFSLAEYAFAKHLPEEWLAKTCRLETRKDRNNGTTWLYIPYYNAAGEESTYRKRYAHKDFRWRTGSSGKICLYGEWRIPEFANAGYAVMVEGESDTQSLWYMGIPAIGVPGASMFKPEQSSVLQGLKLYLHHEPDGGGDTFIHKICTGLRDGGYEGEVYEWSCKALGEKDPSDLYIKHGREQAAKLIRDLVLRVGAAAESVRPVAVHAVREYNHALDFLGVVLIAVLVALHREGKAAARGNLDGSAVDAGFIVQIVHLILEFGCQFRVETVVGGGQGEVFNGGQFGALFCGCHSMYPPIYSSSSASTSAGSASSKPSFSAAACSSGVGVSSLRSAS